jgi:aryl-alcohol dehydrogenase-like predicted oxidoreductase|tara:strand:+ start:640 stop:1680 length:1041 start_codon:yes stop_codon:yes gene_type:complete
MKFKKLGNTSIDVSLICLGTMTWGEQNSQEEAFEQMNYALEKGVNFFDTAELYAVPPKSETFGKTEEIIGNWFINKKNRKKIILASKIAGPRCEWIRGGKNNYSEKKIQEAIDGSLKRLKTDYIDLYQLHWPERTANFFGKLGYEHDETEGEWNDFESILRALEKFIKQGKIRYIGISNETPYGLSKYLEISQNKNLPRVMSVQNAYSLVNRTYEVGLAEISVREKSGLLAYSPLAAGYLSGKYMNNNMPKDSRMHLFGDMWKRYQDPRAIKAYEEYNLLAKEIGVSLTELSLAFVNSRPFVTSNIIGATSMDQLKENIGSIEVELNKEIIDKINLIHKNNPNPSP